MIVNASLLHTSRIAPPSYASFRFSRGGGGCFHRRSPDATTMFSKKKSCRLGVVACSAAAAAEMASVDEIASVEKEKASVSKIRVSSGCPMPLGAVSRDDGVNLAIFSNGATAVTLCLFTPSDLEQVRHLINYYFDF